MLTFSVKNKNRFIEGGGIVLRPANLLSIGLHSWLLSSTSPFTLAINCFIEIWEETLASDLYVVRKGRSD